MWNLFLALGLGAVVYYMLKPATASAAVPPTSGYPVIPPFPPAPTQGTPLPYSGQQPGNLGPGSTISWVGTYQGHDIYQDQNGVQWIMDAGGQWVVSPYPDPTEIPDTAPTH